MNRDVVFSLENLSFSYPTGEPALYGVNLEIRRGERVCLLGANGCGKSTLLKILAGLLFPQGGSFSAFGEEINERHMRVDSFAGKYHRQVGFLFQEPDVQLFCGSVREEVAFGLLQQGLSPEEAGKRTDDMLRYFGLEPLAEKAPFRLSGGEKKKTALAAVLAMNPEVLLLDEPTGGLDPRTQTWFLHLLDALSRAGHTLIISTHSLGLVPRLSDRAILFSESHQAAADCPSAGLIKNLPLLRSAGLIGSEENTDIWGTGD